MTARLGIRLYGREKEALESALVSKIMRPTELLRALVTLDYCDKETYMELGDERCTRVLLYDDGSYKRLNFQITACRHHLKRSQLTVDALYKRMGVGLFDNEFLFEALDCCRRIDNNLCFLDENSATLSFRPCLEPGARDSRFEFKLKQSEKEAFQRVAASVGADVSDLLRGLALHECRHIEANRCFELINGGKHVFLDIDALSKLASDIRSVGYVFNSACKDLNTLLKSPDMGSERAVLLLQRAAERLNDTAEGLCQLVTESYQLLRCSGVRIRRIGDACKKGM